MTPLRRPTPIACAPNWPTGRWTGPCCAFAELVLKAGGKTAADIGCGPGYESDYLHQAGVEVFGLDLSSGMVAQARRLHPGLAFGRASMTALPVAPGALSGILAWYSTIHVPTDHLPGVFAEFHRALRPGGYAPGLPGRRRTPADRSGLWPRRLGGGLSEVARRHRRTLGDGRLRQCRPGPSDNPVLTRTRTSRAICWLGRQGERRAECRRRPSARPTFRISYQLDIMNIIGGPGEAQPPTGWGFGPLSAQIETGQSVATRRSSPLDGASNRRSDRRNNVRPDPTRPHGERR